MFKPYQQVTQMHAPCKEHYTKERAKQHIKKLCLFEVPGDSVGPNVNR